jgi:hypothetical protein
LCTEDNKGLKEIFLLIFGLLFVAGLVVFQIKFIKDLNPNAELLNDLLKWMSANKKLIRPKNLKMIDKAKGYWVSIEEEVKRPR